MNFKGACEQTHNEVNFTLPNINFAAPVTMSSETISADYLSVAEQGCTEADIMGASTQVAKMPWCNVGTSGQRWMDKNSKVVKQLDKVAGCFTSYCDGVA